MTATDHSEHAYPDLAPPPLVPPEELLADADRPDDAPDHPFGDWQVTGPGSAEWVMNRIRAARHQLEEDITPALAHIEVLEAALREQEEFVATRRSNTDAEIQNWEALLVAYYRRVRAEKIAELVEHYKGKGMTDAEARAKAEDKAPKSWPLSTGKVTSTRQSDRLDVDNDTVIAWARRHAPNADLVEYRPHVTKTMVQKFIKRTGVIPDGVDIVPGTEDERSYTVKVNQ